jgi:hypothetical protein
MYNLHFDSLNTDGKSPCAAADIWNADYALSEPTAFGFNKNLTIC